MAQRAGVTFELERLELDGDRLVVSGHWSGVRGLRFVRPMLLDRRRRILATLEHKPWEPSLDRAWVAAFPWEGDVVDVDALTLAVAPQVTVALADAAAPQPAVPAARAPIAPGPASQPPREPRLTTRITEDRDSAGDDAGTALAAAVEARESAVRAWARSQTACDEAVRARAATEAELAHARRERDAAVAARDAAGLRLAETAARLDAVVAERDEAVAELAEAIAERDELRGAYRALARSRPARPQVSGVDVWIIRVLGAIAVGCFVLLLTSLALAFF